MGGRREKHIRSREKIVIGTVGYDEKNGIEQVFANITDGFLYFSGILESSLTGSRRSNNQDHGRRSTAI